MFSDEQINGILKERQPVPSTVALCRKCGVSDATFYKWRSKYGGMDVPTAERPKTLEKGNTKLKRLLVNTILGLSTLKEMLGKSF